LLWKIRLRVEGIASRANAKMRTPAPHSHPLFSGTGSEICRTREAEEGTMRATTEGLIPGLNPHASNCCRISSALWYRFLGSRSRQRLTMVLSTLGTLASICDAGIARSWVRFIRLAGAVSAL